MNAKQKVIDAITHFENQEKALTDGISLLKEQERIVAACRQQVIRTLKAVYGDRSIGGVVFRGKQYVVRKENSAAADELVITNATFEVLG